MPISYTYTMRTLPNVFELQSAGSYEFCPASFITFLRKVPGNDLFDDGFLCGIDEKVKEEDEFKEIGNNLYWFSKDLSQKERIANLGKRRISDVAFFEGNGYAVQNGRVRIVSEDFSLGRVILDTVNEKEGEERFGIKPKLLLGEQLHVITTLRSKDEMSRWYMWKSKLHRINPKGNPGRGITLLDLTTHNTGSKLEGVANGRDVYLLRSNPVRSQGKSTLFDMMDGTQEESVTNHLQIEYIASDAEHRRFVYDGNMQMKYGDITAALDEHQNIWAVLSNLDHTVRVFSGVDHTPNGFSVIPDMNTLQGIAMGYDNHLIAYNGSEIKRMSFPPLPKNKEELLMDEIRNTPVQL